MPTAAQISHPDFRMPALTADIVVITRIRDEDVAAWQGWHEERPDTRGPNPDGPGWYVLLIGRKNPPYPHEEGYYCTPGGFVDYGEDPNAAAPRELEEETHLPRAKLPKMKLVGVYGNPKRDPRRHVITLAYTCHLKAELARAAYGGDDAKFTAWVRIEGILDGTVKMGFDHKDIVRDALTFVF